MDKTDSDRLQPAYNKAVIGAGRKLCIPIAVSSDDIGKLEEIIKQGRILDRGERAFEQHAPLHLLFCRPWQGNQNLTLSEEGEERVRAYLPGVIGLDSVSMDNYSCSASALERTSVVGRITRKLESLASPRTATPLLSLMNREIQGSRQLTMPSVRTQLKNESLLLLSLHAF